jgi:outer membrane protein OmpU
MKKVLLTSTALVMVAGAAAAEMTMSASAKLSYGNFGTGDYRSGYSAPNDGAFALDAATGTISAGAATFDGSAGTSNVLTGDDLTAAAAAYTTAMAVAGATEADGDAAGLAAGLLSHAHAAAAPDAAWGSEADLDIAGSGAGGTFSYSATLEIDESGLDAGAFTISTGGLTFTYDENDVGSLVSTGADGEDDNTGDYMVSYSAGGLSASYNVDTASEDSEIVLGYAMGDLTIGLSMDENDNAAGGDALTKTSVGYVMGAATISLSADDADDWDASVAYVSGNTTMTVAADENSIYSVGLAYAAGDMTFTARQEFGGDAAGDSETEFGITYAAGDMTFGAKYDSGDANDFGDEAETVVNASYAIDGVTMAAKANDQDEVEVSVSFAF